MRVLGERTVPPILALTCVALVAMGFAAPCAAEIYGWVDSNGTFTYSNLPPPKDARVTDVIAEEPARASGAAPARQADIAALNDRIRLLELQRDRERMRAAEIPAPPAYFPPAPPQPAYGCGPDGDSDCSVYGGPYYVTAIGPAYYYGRRAFAHRGHGAPSRPMHVASAHAGSGRR